MNVRVALRLGRVSNLPTVVSNVLAGVALAGRHPAPVTIALVCLAMSLMYVAGMFLNDAFDRDIDRVERPERPIPAGAVTAAAVFDAGFAMLVAGVAIVAGIAIVTGAGGKPVLVALALAASIVLYDARHKGNPIAPFVMGACRACVYLTAGLAVRDTICGELALGSASLVAYVVGLTYIAKQENLREMKNLWPLAFLVVPFVAAWPHDLASAGVYVALLSWVLRALGLLRARKIRDAVTGLIAGIALLDALWIVELGRPHLALIAIAAFVATAALQRLVPGT
jgi:4-hydroxybenzoate polyprenyltransferase